MNSTHLKSFEQFLIANAVSLELADAVKDIVSACVDIANTLSGGAIDGLTGAVSTQNSHGETQKTMDVLSNQILKDKLLLNKHIGVIASEEESGVVRGAADGKFAVAFDPLDGSSNIDINGSVGTIFSILPADTQSANTAEAAFLQCGNKQLCAGYVLYGPATELVITFGKGTYVFTLLEETKQFMLTRAEVSIAKETAEFAVNMANARHWSKGFNNYIQQLLEGPKGPRQKSYNMRWCAAMVADIHRIVSRGGIFLYPSDLRPKLQKGKLRLVYEANPMAMLIENAGGSAFDESNSLLSITPTSIHQKTPVIMGATNEVHACLNYL